MKFMSQSTFSWLNKHCLHYYINNVINILFIKVCSKLEFLIIVHLFQNNSRQ